MDQQTPEGTLSWRLSSHPITLLWFLGFRVCKDWASCPFWNAPGDWRQNVASLVVYLIGVFFTHNLSVNSALLLPSCTNFVTLLILISVLIFIITILLLAADFYYLKNIAGRRLVGLRWWNEVHPETGDSHWVFESSDPSTKVISATDRRFFWLALYSQPLLWVGLALIAIIKFEFIWLTLVGEWLKHVRVLRDKV